MLSLGKGGTWGIGVLTVVMVWPLLTHAETPTRSYDPLYGQAHLPLALSVLRQAHPTATTQHAALVLATINLAHDAASLRPGHWTRMALKPAVAALGLKGPLGDVEHVRPALAVAGLAVSSHGPSWRVEVKPEQVQPFIQALTELASQQGLSHVDASLAEEAMARQGTPAVVWPLVAAATVATVSYVALPASWEHWGLPQGSSVLTAMRMWLNRWSYRLMQRVADTKQPQAAQCTAPDQKCNK